MPNYFRPYENMAEKYIFISYSHRDSEKVLEKLNDLRQHNYRIWYDEGIAAGSDWPLSVQKHLQFCDTVVFFLSDSSMNSKNCFSEIKTARELGKRIICCRLDGSRPTKMWEDVLEGAVYSDSIIECFDDILKGPYDDAEVSGGSRKTLSVLLIASIAALMVSVFLAYMIFTGRLDDRLGIAGAAEQIIATPVPTVDIEIPNNISFPDKIQEKAVRYALGRSDEETVEALDIPNVKELYICGNMPLKNADSMEYDESGNCLVNGAPVQGTIEDLSFISGFAYLEKLVITKQKITDISPLSGLKLLKELDVSGNPISGLDGISGFISLEKLNVEHTDIKDLSPLTALPGLKKVYVSKDMLPLTLPENASFETVLVK